MKTPMFSNTFTVSVFLLILAASLLYPIHVQAKPLSTDVGGVISTDTTWVQADSPYIVTSDVAVQSGVTLTVEPGVEIRFSAGTTLYVDGGFRRSRNSRRQCCDDIE